MRSKTGHLLHKSGYFDSDMHTTVLDYCKFQFQGFSTKQSHLYDKRKLLTSTIWFSMLTRHTFIMKKKPIYQHYQIVDFDCQLLNKWDYFGERS